MDLSEAKDVIADPEASFQDKYHATNAIVNADAVQPEDLLPCLDIEGVSAEMAAMKLHLLTGRKRDNEPLGVYLDRQSWEQFLKLNQ